MDNNEFANRIAQLRRQRGLSQKELGDLLGVSNKAVSKWENGESMPKTSTMLKLAELMEIDGNELIGFEGQNSNEDEIKRLKIENAELSSRLNKIDKARKRALAIVAIICAVGIIASCVVAFCFGPTNAKNSSIKDVGEKDTSITFDGKSFYSTNKLEDYLINNSTINDYHLFDTKYATYHSADGKDKRVAIQCDELFDFIRLDVGGNHYYYSLKKDNKTILSTYNVDGVALSPQSIKDTTSIEKESYFDSYYYYKDDNADSIKLVCEFYNKLGKPVDEKITQSYLGNNAKILWISHFNWDSYYNYGVIKLGEFFTDNKSNMYFYDYVTSNSYSVGKEMRDYVK